MNSNSHELARLLAALGVAGVELAPHPTDPERLRHRPANPPTDLLTRLRLHRAAVRTLLMTGYAPAAHSDEGHVLVERLGMADEQGMPTHPGSAAWLVAVGEAMESRCRTATLLVECGHGATDQGHCGGGEGERAGSGSDRQGRGRGP